MAAVGWIGVGWLVVGGGLVGAQPGGLGVGRVFSGGGIDHGSAAVGLDGRGAGGGFCGFDLPGQVPEVGDHVGVGGQPCPSGVVGFDGDVERPGGVGGQVELGAGGGDILLALTECLLGLSGVLLGLVEGLVGSVLGDGVGTAAQAAGRWACWCSWRARLISVSAA